MKQLTAFTSKELLESVRTGKILILSILFLLFGIMNPAIAKLTPWLMEILSESLTETGVSIISVEINAFTSWTQFYKNIPIAFIIFLLIFSNTLTGEYQKGTLINIITKGMNRWKIIVSKGITIISFWTIGYWLMFGITYGYNAYFWDNNIVSHIFFSAVCSYLIGIWLISLILLMSTIFRSNSFAILAVGGAFLMIYFIGSLPKIGKYMPIQLLNSMDLLLNIEKISEYSYAIIITIILSILNIVASIICFNRKNI